MVSPSSRVPKRAPDRFFVALEACGDGSPNLGLFLEVWLFIGILSGDETPNLGFFSEEVTSHRAAAKGVAVPRRVVTS